MSKLFGQHIGSTWRLLALAVLSIGGVGMASVLSVDATAASLRPPAPTITAHPSTLTTSTSAMFEFSDTTSAVTFQCALDREPYAACSSPMTYPAQSLGRHTFAVEAVAAPTGKNRVTTSSPAKYSWTVNLPTPTFSEQPTTPTASTVATFAFSDATDAVRFECSLDGARYASCSSPVTYTNLAIGPHVFSVEAVMQREPTSAPATVAWTITRETVASTTQLEPIGAATYGFETAASFTGTVTGGAGDGYPMGAVTLTTTGVTLCTTTLNVGTGDTASFSCSIRTTTLLAGGAYTVRAHYAGGTSSDTGYTYSGSTSAGQSLTIAALAPIFTITVTGSSSVVIPVGTSASLGVSGLMATTGTITFKTLNGATMCTLTLPSTSCATSTTLTAGAYSITGDFSPTSSTPNFTASTSSNTVSLAIGSTLSTSVVLGSTSTRSTYGSEYFTARGTVVGVNGYGYPMGTVTVVTTTGTTLCTTTLEPYSSTVATSYYNRCLVETGTLPAGTYSIHTHYAGGPSSDPGFSYGASTSTPLSYTVDPLAPSFSITVTGTTSAFITVDSSATLAETGLKVATGTVTFKTGNGTTMCTLILPATSCATSTTLTAGAYSITGYFTPSAGTTNYTASTSGPVSLTVRVVKATTTSLTIFPSAADYATETTVVFSGTVTGLAGYGDPQGTVMVETATGVVLCTMESLAGVGTAKATFSCTMNGQVLDASTTAYAVTATYEPSATGSSSTSGVTYATSASTPQTLTVTRTTEPTTTTLSMSGSTITYGTETTLSFSGTAIGQTGDGHPQGSVVVTDATVSVLCTSALTPSSTDVATFSCTVTTGTLLPASATAYPVVATFEPSQTASSSTPNVAYTASASTTQSLSVSQASATTTTTLTAPATVTAGTTIVFSGTVTGAGLGYPTGVVTVYSTTGSSVCASTLSTGSGATASFSCSVAGTTFAVGTYFFYAIFTGGTSSTPNYFYNYSYSPTVTLGVKTA